MDFYIVLENEFIYTWTDNCWRTWTHHSCVFLLNMALYSRQIFSAAMGNR